MKKISVLLILALLSGLTLQTPCYAKFFPTQKIKIEQRQINKSTINEIKNLVKKQEKAANNYSIDALMSLYSKDFVNSDGFNYDVYKKMVQETWETYPNIVYKTEIKNIEFSDNYATVFVNETAVATPKENIGEFETVGELYSVSKCVYHLEKQGNKWLINSEKIIEETSLLRYGNARYIDIKLNAPKQIGANKHYTATLKAYIPENLVAVGSISREKIIYPQTKSEDDFRRIYSDNILERVFISNSDNVNEYTIASMAISEPIKYQDEIRMYLKGIAFIMTRVNVIPENKYVTFENKEGNQNE